MGRLKLLWFIGLCIGSTACSAPGLRSTDSSPAPKAADTRMHVASVAEQSGQQEVALSLYAAASRAEPDNIEAQLRYADAASRFGQQTVARSAVAASLGRHPNNPSLLRLSGKFYLVEGHPVEALVQFRQAVALQGDGVPAFTAQALTGEGVAEDMLGDHVEAQRLYHVALAADPLSLAAANNQAMSLLLSGHPAEAAAQFDALRKRPDATPRVEQNYALAAASAGAPGGLVKGGASSKQIEALVAELRRPSVLP